MSNKPVVLFCFSPLPFFPLGLFIIVGNASKRPLFGAVTT